MMSHIKTQREIEDDAAADYERAYQESQDRMSVSTSKVNSSGAEFGLEDQQDTEKPTK
jgi:hypothetical protein